MMQRINPGTLYDTSSLGMSHVSVDMSGLLFVSGQVAWDVQARVIGTTYKEQTRIALDNLELALHAAGSDLEHLLHVRVYVRGELAEHMAEIGPVIASRLGASRPALTGIGVASLVTRDTLVEIEAVGRTRAT